jgi:hypothetical protein
MFTRSPLPRALASEKGLLRTFVVALVVTNLLLLVQNRRLQASAEVPDGPAAGQSLASIVGAGSVRPKLVMYLSTHCRFCSAQMPAWRSFLERTAGDFEPVFVFGESDRPNASGYLEHAGVSNVRAVYVPDLDLSAARLTMTPTTIYTDANGTIRRVWPGAWDEATAADVVAAVGSSNSRDCGCGLPMDASLDPGTAPGRYLENG